MTSQRSLENRLGELEDEATTDELFLSMFTTTISPDGPEGEKLPIGAAMRLDRRVNRRSPGGVEVYTDADREDFNRRLDVAIDTLADRDGMQIDRNEFLRYVARRSEGDVVGEAGVREHFDSDVSPAQINQLWEWTVGQIPDPDAPMDQRPRVINRPIPEGDE